MRASCAAIILTAIFVAPATRASEVVGRVVEIGGRPVAGEQVRLREEAKDTSQTVVTDAMGRYWIQNVKPGPYVLYVRNQSAVAYVDEPGLTVDWGVSPGAPPVAVATRGIAPALASVSPTPKAAPNASATAVP
jgi:hypothetical protein